MGEGDGGFTSSSAACPQSSGGGESPSPLPGAATVGPSKGKAGGSGLMSRGGGDSPGPSIVLLLPAVLTLEASGRAHGVFFGGGDGVRRLSPVCMCVCVRRGRRG